MYGGQQAWRTTAEVYGLDGIGDAIPMALRFRQGGFDELRVGELPGRVLVESAVGADVVAEGNVGVEMHVQEISRKDAEAQRRIMRSIAQSHSALSLRLLRSQYRP